MRLSLLAVLAVSLPSAVSAQSSPSVLRQLEAEVVSRIAIRAKALGRFRLDSSDFDLRVPIRGEPEETVGPTLHANASLGVASARLEPLDSIGSQSEAFVRGRYQLRLEDRRGNCLLVYREVSIDTALVRGRRRSERCQPLYMADVVRRSRRIVRLPFSAGSLDAQWSVAPMATGFADVYMDSVIVTAASLAIRANNSGPDTATQMIDSISAGIASGDESWNVVRTSVAIPVDTALRRGEQWSRQDVRFMIPIDSAFALDKSWPLFQVHLALPKTESNPSGLGWTYAHERRDFFAALRPATKP